MAPAVDKHYAESFDQNTKWSFLRRIEARPILDPLRKGSRFDKLLAESATKSARIPGAKPASSGENGRQTGLRGLRHRIERKQSLAEWILLELDSTWLVLTNSCTSPYSPTVRTMRKRALPLIMRS
jgi:hypothetical protein